MNNIPFGGEIKETSDAVTLSLNIDGIDPKKINVEVGTHAIKVSATVEHTKEIHENNIHRKEVSVHTYQRSIPLPSPVITTDVKAFAKGGKLTINLLKQKIDKPVMKQIPVEEL